MLHSITEFSDICAHKYLLERILVYSKNKQKINRASIQQQINRKEYKKQSMQRVVLINLLISYKPDVYELEICFFSFLWVAYLCHTVTCISCCLKKSKQTSTLFLCTSFSFQDWIKSFLFLLTLLDTGIYSEINSVALQILVRLWDFCESFSEKAINFLEFKNTVVNYMWTRCLCNNGITFT